MTDKQNNKHPNRIKWWVSALSLFFIVQLIFFAVDGTFLEPNLNDSDNLGGRAADWLQESELFTEWITPFSFPLFNMVTTLLSIVLLVIAVTDIFSSKLSNK